jgi:hypothetical protein
LYINYNCTETPEEDLKVREVCRESQGYQIFLVRKVIAVSKVHGEKPDHLAQTLLFPVRKATQDQRVETDVTE